MMRPSDKEYGAPAVHEYGSVESITTQSLDKIGSADDGVNYALGDLDGTIVRDS